MPRLQVLRFLGIVALVAVLVAPLPRAADAADGCGQVEAPNGTEQLALRGDGLVLHVRGDGDELVAVDGSGGRDGSFGTNGSRPLDLGGFAYLKRQLGDRLAFVVRSAGEELLVVTDLDGDPDPGFADDGSWVVGPDDYRGGLRAVTELPNGNLVAVVDVAPDDYEGTYDLQLVVLDANGVEQGRTQVASEIASSRDAWGVVASGNDHVHLWTRGYNSGHRVHRIALGDGQPTAGFPAPVQQVSAMADRPDGGVLIVELGTVQAFRPDGTVDTAFGDGGAVDLSDELGYSDTAIDQGNHVVLFGNGGSVSAAVVDDDGLAVDVGDGGLFRAGEYGEGVTDGRLLTTGRLLLLVDGTQFGEQFLVVLGADGTVDSDCAAAGEVTATRTAGPDRYATAAAVVAEYFESAATVLMATGENFPDALAGGAAAVALDAPVLLTRQGALPAAALEQLERLKPGRILLLGGTTAVSADVERTLEVLPWGPDVERIAGADRYETAVMLSRTVFSAGVANVYVATGRTFPDALAAVPVAAVAASPILLVPGDEDVPEVVAEEVRRLAPTDGATVVGGHAAIDYGFDESLRQHVDTVDRVEGADRYQTAAAVAKGIERSSGPVFLASGTGFADALAAGPAAGRMGAPLLLTAPEALTEVTRNDLARRGPRLVNLIGGTAALAPAVEDAINRTDLGYAYISYVGDDLSFFQGGGGSLIPRSWDACRAIEWSWYRGESPDEHLAFIQDGLTLVTAQTGATFAYRGETDVIPADGFGGGSGYPVPIGFTYLGPFSAGLAGPDADPTDDRRYRGGSVAINELLGGGPLNYDGAWAGYVLVHEVGHLLGLDHVGWPDELMTQDTLDDQPVGPAYQTGDLEGLARTVDRSGC